MILLVGHIFHHFQLSNSSAPILMEYKKGRGLFASINGIRVIQGSGCQVFAPNWTAGYYSTAYNQQTITAPDSNTINVSFAGHNNDFSANLSYKLVGSTIQVLEKYKWSGDEVAYLEVTAAKFWTPALISGTVSQVSGPASNLPSFPSFNKSEDARNISQFQTGTCSFTDSWGSLTVTPIAPTPTPAPNPNWVIFDGRNYNQDWASGKSLFWFGTPGLPLPKGKEVDLSYQINLSAPILDLNVTKNYELISSPSSGVEHTVDETLPLVPNPKQVVTQGGQGLEITNKYSFPAGNFFHFEDFTNTLKQRFHLEEIPKGMPPLIVDGGLADLKLPKEGYKITVRKDGFSVLGEDENGFRYGLRRLALMAYTQGGHVYLPIGTLTDWPSTSWRGFHMFSGPDSISFQTQILNKVIGPLGYNHAVIQCERTAWSALPNVRGPKVMTKPDLLKLFQIYRSAGIDPIPLIESFGHDEWIFQDNKNLELAVDKDDPYALDPRVPATTILWNNLWDEVVGLLHPDFIHFGLDEIALKGFADDGKLLTDLWKIQIPVLGEIAKKHDVKMMMWGDEALAPKEAIDATNAPSVEVAQERRDVIPSGTYITDWHYKKDANLADYFSSLDIWKAAGMNIIGASCLYPENVQGFTSAIVQEHGGSLQPTWAGYETNLDSPVTDFDTFAALVLSAEYSWSGQQTPVKDLGYDYRQLFWQLYFEPKIHLTNQPGSTFFEPGPKKSLLLGVGTYNFAAMKPIELQNVLTNEGIHQPSEVTIKLNGTGKQVNLALSTQVEENLGNPVAELDILLANGRVIKRLINYGCDVRTPEDKHVTPLATQGGGLGCIQILFDKTEVVTGIRFKALSTTAGLVISGISIEK